MELHKLMRIYYEQDVVMMEVYEEECESALQRTDLAEEYHYKYQAALDCIKYARSRNAVVPREELAKMLP